MYDISVILMASGFSKRMGQNKLLLEIENKKIYQHTVTAIQESQINQKIIVSSYDEILDYCEKNTDFFCVKNNNSHLGQSQSIKLGILNSSSCRGYMFLPCDMPFITPSIIDEIADYFMKDITSIVVPRIHEKNTMPTIFSYDFKEELLNISGDIGGRDIIKKYIDKVRYMDIKGDELLVDIDTKEDLKKYIKAH